MTAEKIYNIVVLSLELRDKSGFVRNRTEQNIYEFKT